LKGHKFVRHGAEKAVVEWDFGDGHTLYWEKGEKVKPMYRIDGGPPIYPGTAVPTELAVLGIMPLTIGTGDRDIWPQIAQQVTGQVFLLDQPGSLLAEVVADVDRVGQLNRALSSAERDKRAATAKLKIRREDEARQVKEVAAFDGFDAARDQIAVVEKQLVQVGRVAKAVEAVTDLRDRLVTARNGVASLVGVEQITLPSEGSLDSIRRDRDRLADLLVLRNRLAKARSTAGSLVGIEGVVLPDEAEFSGLRGREGEIAALCGLRDRLVKARAEAERLGGVETFAATVDTTFVEKARAALAVLESLKARRVAACEAVSRAELELVQTSSAAEVAAQEVRDILGDLHECPVCGAAVE